MKYILPLILLFTHTFCQAYDSMHEKTPVGEIKVLELPERIALQSSFEGSYFEDNNGLFRKLFRFISANDLSMTTPVEGDINPGKMRFFVGQSDRNKDFQSSKEVEVKKMKPRLVVAIGIRGGYSSERFFKHLDQLENWIRENDHYEKNGNAYGVYWNGPFIPGPFKRSEVHLPIQLKDKKSDPPTTKK